MVWYLQPRVYVENSRSADAAYHVKAEAVVEFIGRTAQLQELTCCYDDDRDLPALGRADILITGRIDTTLIADKRPPLKLIQCTSAGVERYAPFSWLPKGTVLTNASGVHARKVAEFGLMATLMLHERVPAISTRQRRHAWSRLLRGAAAGSTVMIYGMGALGGAVAERLRAAEFRVVGVNRSGRPHLAVERMLTPKEFRAELPGTDILILACPLTAETRGLIGERELAALPLGAGVLNISRGAVIDHEALLKALISGHISGAILDVFEQEPLPPESALWDAPNLMVFPHVSADSPDGYIDRCLAILAENLERLRLERPLRNVVDPQRGY